MASPKPFILHTEFDPCGDQPQAIDKLVKGLNAGVQSQVLLGITGSGKTFTMANVIAQVQRPTLIMAHNKTLAAQLYQEFKSFFPENAVEYFVSYYDYYQPEAYIPRTDTYIEKDMAINDKIDKMRMSATRSLLERSDVIIVSSVSCIYGLGSPEHYRGMNFHLKIGESRRRDDLLIQLVEMQYKRNDYDFSRGQFRVRGDIIDVFPSYEDDLAIRIEMFGDEIEKIGEIDPLTGRVKQQLAEITLYPGSHHVTPEEVRWQAMESIRTELEERVQFYEDQKKLLELERIQQRTLYDLKMLREVGTCKGIENYSRHFNRREPGSAPSCLLDYFPKDFVIVIDESHQTMPQIRAMYNGDRARKHTLIDFGFRLPSAYDNRPLKFEEFLQRISQTIYVSATPSEWEVKEAGGEVIEQVIRPTGLLDPIIEVRPALTQVDDCLSEIRTEVNKGRRVLVTTLTKKLAEELTKYLNDLGVKSQYLHADIDTLERTQTILDLRTGKYDVLVGINLLREGIDIPEVSLVAVLDADKEGFLRSETSLIQICGRAARNSEGRVIMYADRITDSIQKTLDITRARRANQEAYNLEHGITPTTVKREISFLVEPEEGDMNYAEAAKQNELMVAEAQQPYLSLDEIKLKIKENEMLMKKAAKEMRFDEAAHFRDLVRQYQQMELMFS
jgi:excinuclease ABC subunit B